MQKDILTLSAECLVICRELVACLEEERVALITLNTENIVQTNFKKETLGSELKLKYREVGLLAKAKHGADHLSQISSRLPVPVRETWDLTYSELKKSQLEVQALAEANQRFLRHSLKNLGLIVDNLKRLFGLTTLYSPQGKKVDGPQSGRMVEASY